MAENSGFCPKCGTPMQNGVCPRCGYSDRPAPAPAQSNSSGFAGNDYSAQANVANLDYSKIFTSPKERYVGSLGNGYLANFLTRGYIGNGFAVLSDKRVYFRGNMINVEGKKLMQRQTSKAVDLKDVTGTGVQTFSNVAPAIVCFVLALISLISFIVLAAATSRNSISVSVYGGAIHSSNDMSPSILIGLIFTIAFIAGGAVGLVLGRKTLFQIEFAGGCIAFNVKLYGFQACESFQKMLRTAKDNAVEEAENAAAEAMRSAVSAVAAVPAAPQPAASSAADELMKYADLLEKKLITEEEFAKAKADILAGKK